MSTPQLELPADQTTLMIVGWHDPVVDSIGFEVRSTYVELFWLNVLGPTATWLLRLLVRGLDRYPLGYELDLAETAGTLGLGYTAGTGNPFLRSLNRCVLFGVAQPFGGGLAVRRRLPPVAARHLARMPDALRATHDEWVPQRTSVGRAHPPEHDGERARILAAALVAVGDDADAVERQLLALGVDPPVAVELAAAGISAGPDLRATRAALSSR